MPLLDHFRGELAERRHWESFHSMWASAITRHLNERVLPADYFAEAQVSLGRRIEVDVATLQEREHPEPGEPEGSVAVQTWAPPRTALLIPALFPDDLEVQILQQGAGPTLVGAIELISPGNKDRPEARRAFAAKCAAYLQRGVGLVIVDVVTRLQANLHDELIALLGQPSQFAYPSDSLLYAVAYRPTQRQEAGLIETWPNDLALGQPLPTVPLPLLRGPVLPLDLESTYTETRAGSRL